MVQHPCPPAARPRRRPARRRGGAALEFMLVLPTLMLVLVGMLALSNFLTTRYYLTAAAIHAARTCTLRQARTLACVTDDVQRYLPAPIRARCSALQVITANTPLGNGINVQTFDVDLRCAYDVGIGAGFLGGQGIQLTELKAQGSMPWSP